MLIYVLGETWKHGYRNKTTAFVILTCDFTPNFTPTFYLTYLSISKKSKLVPAKFSPSGQISTRKKTPFSCKMTLSTSFQNDQQHERQDMAAICFFYAGWSRSINLLLRKSNLAQSETLPLLSDICLLSMKVKEKLPWKMCLQKEYIHFQIQWKQ